MKNRGLKPLAVNSIPGQVEAKLERQNAVWRRRSRRFLAMACFLAKKSRVAAAASRRRSHPCCSNTMSCRRPGKEKEARRLKERRA